MNNTLVRVAVASAFVFLLVGGCPWLNPPNSNENENANVNDNGSATDKPRHERIFTDILPEGYQGTQSCLTCHAAEAQDLLQTGHWNWAGTVANIAGLEGQTHGKIDLLNNFCIAVPSNEGRCSQCHPSYGWTNNTFDFSSTANIDCLVCHDTTGKYRKDPTANGGGGRPALIVDGTSNTVAVSELQEVAYSVGEPSRGNCGLCHFYAGGDDNVKHGDLSSAMASPSFELDVHMDASGNDFTCQKCHTVEKHGIAGMPLHSVNEGGESPDCTRCHGTKPHGTGVVAVALNLHTAKVACQTCHIPTFARAKPTKVEWYWSEAGQDVSPIPTDEFGMATYDKKKGSFVWDMNVTPTLMWFDGKWTRKVINVSDTYTEAGTTEDPIVLAMPTATKDTAGAKIYPFKKMIGNQPVDPVNKRLVVPHLFGSAAGSNAYWAKYDWAAAISEGTAYAGQPYSGEFAFGNTVMYLTVNHEVAPKQNARTCETCHGVTGFFEALGYEKDPFPN